MSKHPRASTAKKKKVLGTMIMFTVLGAIAFALAIPELGTTRGRYANSAFLFPYAFLIVRIIPEHSLQLLLILAQYPAYGTFWAWASRNERQYWATFWLIASHLSLAIPLSHLYAVEYSLGI